MSDRRAEKAGSWYPASPDALRSEIDRYLREAGASPAGDARAIVTPHAGLAFSGPTAARAFAWVRQTQPETKTFLVFGAVHTMGLRAPAIWPEGAWQTPLGPLEVDAELAAALIEAGIGAAGEEPHNGDNAIELQTPFLKACFPGARFVPMAVPPDENAAACGEAAWATCESIRPGTVAVGSTDLTHYGKRAFGFAPAGEGMEALRWSKENDKKLLDAAGAMRAGEIVPIATRDRSACGAGAFAAAVGYARASGSTEGILLEHTTSYDMMPEGEPTHFVGYASLVFPAGGNA
jgi:MEMO1 family protein